MENQSYKNEQFTQKVRKQVNKISFQKSCKVDLTIKYQTKIECSIITCISLLLETPLLCTAEDRHGWLIRFGIKKAHQSILQVPEFEIAAIAQISQKRINSSMPDLINPYL